MIIHPPSIRKLADEVRVEAAFTVEPGGPAAPPTLWFALPSAYEPFVLPAADAFAAALLPFAMHRGEPLVVEGPLSCRLAAGMREYQRIQTTWNPGFFRTVELRCDQLERRDRAACAGAVGAAFSGGVDSFYTVWARLAENEPYPLSRVTHCVMINGFDDDADLEDRGGFRRLAGLYEPMLAGHGIGLVVIRTNLLEILGQALRRHCYGAFLTASALLLGRLFARFHVPSAMRFTTMGTTPDGSHLALDHVLATETMETVHAEPHLSRLEKTLALAGWPETRPRLRVCLNATGLQKTREAIANCCACEKCIRTMVALELAGVLPDYVCFPKPLERRHIRRAEYLSRLTATFGEEIVEHAERVGRKDIARDVRWAVLTSALFRRPARRLVAATNRLKRRWPRLYARSIRPLKELIKRTGWARGWLY